MFIYDHKVKMVFDALRKFIAMFGVAVTEETDMTRTLASRHNSGHGGEIEMDSRIRYYHVFKKIKL